MSDYPDEPQFAGDPVWLDDEGRAMIVNSKHYTAEDITALIAELKRFEDPQQSTQADWNNKDWRALCGVLWRIISALASDVPLAQQGAPDALVAALKKIRRTPAMPFPDAGAHSARAFTEAVCHAWCEIQKIADAALAEDEAGRQAGGAS